MPAATCFAHLVKGGREYPRLELLRQHLQSVLDVPVGSCVVRAPPKWVLHGCGARRVDQTLPLAPPRDQAVQLLRAEEHQKD